MKKLLPLIAALPLLQSSAFAGLFVPSVLPVRQAPQIVSLPAMPLGSAAAVILPSQPLQVIYGHSVRLPNAVHPLAIQGKPVGMILAASAPPQPQEGGSKGDKLDKVYDGSGQRRAPQPVGRPRGERRYYPIPESDLLEELGVK